METRVASGRRMIVAVQWGPLDGRKAVLAPGDTLRVGRGELAGLVVPHDAKMAAVHVEIAWDGERGTFRDLGTPAGTVHNGASGAMDGALRSGDWLKAGATFLTVHVEGHTPARPPEDDSPRARDAEARRAERAETAMGTLAEVAKAKPLYAVLDAARDRRILELCRESVEEYRSLYDGIEGETMAHVAPYLVRLPGESRLLASLVREGWGRRWGIYLTSRWPFREVRRQLRRSLMIEVEQEPATHAALPRHDAAASGPKPPAPSAPNRERVYFRFYDPVTLVDFLSVATPRQAQEFYGGIDAFFAEADPALHDPGVIVHRWPRPAISG